jgi:nucleoside-diphosphate-sugar epimerase
MPAIAFVTGGSSLVGRVLVSRLAERGVRVLALARSRSAAAAVEQFGAEPVLGDLRRPETWRAEARAADVVFHVGLPRVRPPLRRHRVRGLVGEAAAGAAALRSTLGAGRPVVAVSSGLVYGDRAGPATEAERLAPLALARPALAAERALADPELRIVRLPWVYGPEGIIFDLVSALRAGRYRIVGPGGNRWSMLSAEDAAEALLTAASAPPGAYNAAEPDPPSQLEVVRTVCAQAGARRPDHLPPRIAALGLGGPTAEALAASLVLDAAKLAGAGWTPRSRWRRDLVSLLLPGPAAA